MKYLLHATIASFLLLLASTARAAPLVQPQDISVLTVSSVTVNLAGLTNSAQTTYKVATDTLTITVDTTKFIEVCYSGNLTPAGASNHVGWSFMVDGAFILGLTTAKGAVSEYQPSSSESVNASSCFPVPPNTISSGSHKFPMIAVCGNACTFGGSALTSTAYFYIKQYP